MVEVCDFLVEHNEVLGIEAIYDYYPKPWGRGWKCDRQRWTHYESKVLSLTPGGDWLHVELSPDHADDEDWYANRIPALWGKEPAKRISPKKLVTKKGSKGKIVSYLQEQLNRHDHQCEPCCWELKVDGKFGPITDVAVKEFQTNHDAYPIDGIVGPVTWQALDRWADEVI
jgi:hypothetical protein